MVVMSKQPVSFRLTATAIRLLASSAKYLGISKTAVVELAIREKAIRHNLAERPSGELPLTEEQET